MNDSADQQPDVGVAPTPSGPSLLTFLGLVLVPFLLAGVVILVATTTGGSSVSEPSGDVYTFLVPEGTAERMERGEPVDDVFPERMAARVGDTFEVTNDDNVTHQLGPLTVRAGETARITFYQSGTYIGACTVGDHDSVTIQVT